MRGNTSNLAAFSKLFNKCSFSFQSYKINGCGSSNLLKIRGFSSYDGTNSRNGRNEFDGHSDNKFCGRNRGNDGFAPSDGRPVRGDRQRSHFGGERDFRDAGFRSRAGRGDGIGGGGGGGSGEFFKKFKLGDEDTEENRSNVVDSKDMCEEDKMGAPEGADEIFDKMRKSGLIPNAVAMIDGLCKDGLIHEAMKLFKVMREKGTMPDVVVYTAVVDGFCQAGKLDEAMTVFKKMKDSGIVPNAFSYSVLIKGLCKGKRLEDGVDLCVQMLEAGHSPNVPTFTGLVGEFCNEKGLEDAKKVIMTLKQKGFFLDEKAIRVHYQKVGPTSPVVWEAIFGPKKTEEIAI